MKGKYKLFAIGLASLCASVSVANAKSMTAAEITEAITAQNPNATYAYVIGSYVFTGSHMLSTNDVMVASKTIESNDPEDQYINVLSLNESTNKWEYEKNLLGSLISSSTGAVDIQYIDYVPTSDSVNVDKTVADEITKLGDADNNAIISINKNVITVKVSDDLSDEAINTAKSTLADDIFELLASNKKITSVVITQVDEDGDAIGSSLTITERTSKSSITSKLNLINSKESFTIEIKLADDVVNAGKYTTYNVDFVNVIDTNKYFDVANTYFAQGNGTNYTLTCREDDQKCNPVMNILKPNEDFVDVDYLAKVIRTALDDTKNIDRVKIVLGDNRASSTYTSTSTEDVIKTSITNLIKGIIGESGKYSDVAALKTITLTFTLVDGKTVSVWGENNKSEEYVITIDSYLDIDGIVDYIIYKNTKAGGNGWYSSNYKLSRSDSKGNLIFDVILDNNALYKHSNPDRTLDQVFDSFGNSEIKSALGLDAYKDKGIYLAIYGGAISEEDAIKCDNSSCNIANIVKKLAGLADNVTLASGKLTLSMLKGLDVKVKFVVTDESKLMDVIQGTVGYDTDEEGNRYRTVTYNLGFNIDNFNINEAFLKSIVNSNYATAAFVPAKEATTTTPATPNTLTYTLKNVETPLKDIVGVANGTGFYNTLSKYAKLFSSVKIGEKEISLASEEEFKTSIIAALGVDETDTLETLNNKTYKAHLVLAEGVNPNADTNSFDFDLVFKFNVANLSGTDKLSDKLNSSSVVVLENNKTYDEGTLNLSNASVVIRGNGSTIKGDINIKSNSSVKLEDVTIEGKITVNNGVTIKGDNATINGAIDASNANAKVSIDNVTINGTNDALNLTENSLHAVINASKDKDFVLTNSKISYKGGVTVPNNGNESNDKKYVYSLIYANGNATITGNTFDVTNVKNPIEYKYSETAKNVVISDNEFIENNYVSGDAHNIISFYGFKTGATVTIKGNKFEYAHWAIRISDSSSEKKATTYIITDNAVESNKLEYKDEPRKVAAFIGVQALKPNDDLSNITIKYANNTIKNGQYLTGKIYTSDENLENQNVLVYAYHKSSTSFAEGKLPTVTTYIAED